MTGLFAYLKINLPNWGIGGTIEAAIITGVIVLAVAVWAITGLLETYDEDLYYMEQL